MRLLELKQVCAGYGQTAVLRDVSLNVLAGEAVAIIGANGAGKTTLLRCISGLLHATQGSIRFAERDIIRLRADLIVNQGLVHCPEGRAILRRMSVLENLVVPLEYVAHRRTLHTTDTWDEAMAILRQMGMAEKADSPSNLLSQVELRKLELARAMAARPRLLISDEAMAGLAGNEVDEVLKILFDLNATGITIIMIEHIMQAVMRFSQRVICLDAGRIICEGTPAGIVKNPDVQRAYLGA